MPVQRDDPVQLIAQEQVRLFAEFKKLAETSWQQPSYCPGWTIGRVVAHLTRGAEFYHQSVSRALRGDAQPPALPGGQRMTTEQFREASRTKQEELAAKPRQELAAAFDARGSELADLFRRVASHNMTRPAWHPAGERTIAMFVSTRVVELALHGWDIHIALDPGAVIRSQLQPFLVSFQLQIEKRMFQGGAELDGVYRFDLGSQAWTTRVFNNKLEHGPLEPGPDASLKLDSNHFLLLTTGRGSFEELEERGVLRVEGDHDRARKLMESVTRKL